MKKNIKNKKMKKLTRDYKVIPTEIVEKLQIKFKEVYYNHYFLLNFNIK